MLSISCIECGSSHIIKDYQRGETVCCECGLIQEDFSLESAEWQFSETSGFGPAMNYKYYDKGLSTEISRNNMDFYGNKLGNTSQLYRLRKWHKRTSVSNNLMRNLNYTLKELNRMTSKYPSDVGDTSAYIYRKAVKKRLIVGRNAKDFMIASIYISCRICKHPRTIDEILKDLNFVEININIKKKILKSYKILKKELELQVNATNPEHYISRFCNKLKLDQKTEKKAEEIINQAFKKGIIGGANSLAAAAIYIASILCQEKRTQRQVANITGVTDVTIRSRSKELNEKLCIGI